jgi:hypothetical protein
MSAANGGLQDNACEQQALCATWHKVYSMRQLTHVSTIAPQDSVFAAKSGLQDSM